ncbi:MAG: hypothetical protein ISR82_07235 [Candidatus Marinimicrobia bacterium]|nr:hypothetical protein [Candidatus Neomarinimicrobiota bacterium]MBL7010998.1 hypothetical protein [Candidatus Neomarinimicrobiota bacterium]MBL7031322.1 hypothetical protein [Candidatus Neomarinimicrobiota bacterium]
MNANFLLSNRFKNIGWMIFIPSVFLGILWLIFEFEFPILDLPAFALMVIDNFNDEGIRFLVLTEDNYTNEIIGISLIIGGLLVAFSQENEEDEYIERVRMISFVWAVKINYIILFLTLLFLFNDVFLKVMMFNIFSVLLLFIIRFNLTIHSSKKALTNE